MRRWRGVALEAVLLTLAALAPAQAAVVGSGKLQTEARAIGGFDAVTLRGSMTLVLRQSQRERVEVRADDNLLPLIETRVITLSGSGDAQLGGRAARVDLAPSGSGSVAAGAMQADDVDVRLSGSGDGNVNARRTLKVAIAGSGDVTHSGSAAVTRSITGSGSLKTR